MNMNSKKLPENCMKTKKREKERNRKKEWKNKSEKS